MKGTINKEMYDILVVGAGLSGAVIAERFAADSNLKVLAIYKRSHIGGNCYDLIDENGILINKYGVHLFHTNYENVWGYVQKFAEWQRWDYKALGFVDGKFVNIPVNINTVNSLCVANIKDEEEMNKWLGKVQVKYENITNSEEMAKSRVSNELYEKIFKNYTFKQWNKFPSELDSSILARIPIRNNHDERYFDDKYQALPKYGYTKFIENILTRPNITVRTNADYFKLKNKIHFNTLNFYRLN